MSTDLPSLSLALWAFSEIDILEISSSSIQNSTDFSPQLAFWALRLWHCLNLTVRTMTACRQPLYSLPSSSQIAAAERFSSMNSGEPRRWQFSFRSALTRSKCWRFYCRGYQRTAQWLFDTQSLRTECCWCSWRRESKYCWSLLARLPTAWWLSCFDGSLYSKLCWSLPESSVRRQAKVYLFVYRGIWRFRLYDRCCLLTLPSRCWDAWRPHPNKDSDRRWYCWHLSCSRSIHQEKDQVPHWYAQTVRESTSSSWWKQLRWTECRWNRRCCSWVFDRQVVSPTRAQFHFPWWIAQKCPASNRAPCKCCEAIIYSIQKLKSRMKQSNSPASKLCARRYIQYNPNVFWRYIIVTKHHWWWIQWHNLPG